MSVFEKMAKCSTNKELVMVKHLFYKSETFSVFNKVKLVIKYQHFF